MRKPPDVLGGFLHPRLTRDVQETSGQCTRVADYHHPAFFACPGGRSELPQPVFLPWRQPGGVLRCPRPLSYRPLLYQPGSYQPGSYQPLLYQPLSLPGHPR